MNESVYEFLKQTFLFKNLTEQAIRSLLSDKSFEIQNYNKNDVIYSTFSFERKLGFVMEGECLVCHNKSDGDATSLNYLRPCSSFGIMAVLSGYDEFPTTVISKKKTTILFIDQKYVKELISKNSVVSQNVISFLTDRVIFLNDKISTFTAGNVVQKTSSYILALSKREGSDTLTFNKVRAANAVGVGRASLYRALSELIDEDIISIDSKKIYIKNISQLERKTK